MSKILSGKVAAITGASRGIGRQIALTLAENGADLVVNATRTDLLEELKAEVEALGRRCVYVAGSVTDEAVCGQMVQAALDNFGRLDILVNNAGINNRKPTLELTTDEWRKLMDINANGVLYMSKAALPVMVDQHSGCIINITSTASKAAHPNACVAYGASKAAVTYMTKHFAMEFGVHGIRVNAVQCGPIRSDMTDQWTDEYRANVMKKIPVGRLGEPLDVAQAVLYFASDAAGYITGCSLNLSGGKFME